MPRPLPSTSFPIHHSIIILSFNTTQSMILTASINKQEVLGRTNRLPSFDRTRTAYKTKKLGRGDGDRHREQGDLISLLTKISGDTQIIVVLIMI
jgi:hypothetical protein